MNTTYRPLALAIIVALVLIVLFVAAAMAQDAPRTRRIAEGCRDGNWPMQASRVKCWV